MPRWIRWSLPCTAFLVGCAAEPTCEDLRNCVVPKVDARDATTDGSTPIEADSGQMEPERSNEVSPETAVGQADSGDSSDSSVDGTSGSDGDADSGARSNVDASDSPTDAATGDRCMSNGNCASQNCVENVCCDMACAGPCTSCLAANTGRTNGICAPVATGTDPHESCTVGDVKTCGNDGTCDGNGACRKYGASAVCRVESCVNIDASHATYTPASHCNSNGACVSGGTSSGCGNFLCAADTSHCAMTCQTSSDCINSAYCANTTCTPKKPLGAVCTATDQCASSICGGRCCAAPCTCSQPSAQNLFKNPGFESDLSGWNAHNESQWNSQDVDGCPYSGSAQVLFSQGPSQCVAVSPGTSYNFGGWFRNLDGNFYTCSLLPYTDLNCTQPASAALVTGSPVTGSETTWTFKTSGIQISPSVPSLYLYLICDANSNTYIDKLFLSTGGY